jgi:hypothetical protein
VTQYLKPPPGNPVIQLLAAIGAVAGLVISFILGFFAVAIIAGVALLGMLVVGIRIAWLRRRWRRHLQETDVPEQPAAGGATLDAEYEVISRRRR